MKKKPEGWRKPRLNPQKEIPMLISSYFLRCDGDLRDIRVFQSQPAQVQHAHGRPATDEDEEGDELVGKEHDT